MKESVHSQQVVRFGVFELDLRAGELRKHGLKVRLQDQPLQILTMLLERPGEVVTREEIQKKLWPADTFVDFDHSLNTAIKKLRQALGDEADTPRYIETLPRRGYRFIAPVGEFEDNVGARRAMPLQGPRTVKIAPRYAIALAVVIVVAILAYQLIRPLPPPKVLGSVQITNDGRPKGCLVTDGPRLYFCEETGVGSRLAQVSVTGGEVVAIPTPLQAAEVLDISPDHSELLLGNFLSSTDPEVPLWVLPVLGGAPRRLGDLLHHAATWSLDGQMIVYANGPDLYLAKSDGTESRKLVTIPGRPFGPRWSPDGRLLRFSLYDSKTNNNSLWQVSADGSNLHPVLSGGPPNQCCGAWTPDGKYYVFQSSPSGRTDIWTVRRGRTDIWAIREKAGPFHAPNREPVQLTTGPISFSDPVPNVDDKKLFVVGSQPRGELVRYDSKSHEFLPYLSGISAEGVDFSRDGVWVTYVSIPGWTLWRSRLDGSQRLQLTFPPMLAYQPRWSPDGRRIAFEAQLPGRPWKIYVVSAEGGSAQQMTAGERNDGDVYWSPDGSSLIFSTKPWLEGMTSAKTAIYSVDLKTHQVSTLPGSEGLWSPSWSADGRYIAAMPLGKDRLVLFDLTTRKWTELARGSPGFLNWSRDRRYLYFDTFFGAEPAFFRVRISDRKLESLFSMKDFPRGPGLWTTWAGLALDDSPLLVRDVGIQDIYALDVQLP